jgi:3-hydroxyisobutyrate dehydrogenase
MPSKIAFLGLGVMGSAMAANLVKHNFAVVGWNRTPNRATIATFADVGGTVVPSLKEAVQDADVIFSCLGDVPDVIEVLLDGAMAIAKPNALFVDTSTIGSVAAQTIGQALLGAGLRFLDAPVSGGDVGAMNGTLTFMVGGAIADLQECLPLFEAKGKYIKHCGAIGQGQAIKLCNQTLVSVYMLALCETMQLAEKMGVDPQLVVDVCGSGAAGSWALANLGMKVAQGNYQAGFAIKHMLKDLRLVQDMVQDGIDLPAIALAMQNFQIVSQLEDGAEQGTQAMMRAYRHQ